MDNEMEILRDNAVKFLNSQVTDTLDIERVTKETLAFLMFLIIQLDETDQSIIDALVGIKAYVARVKAWEAR